MCIRDSPITGTPLYLQRESIADSRFTFTEQRITRRASGSLNDGTQTQIGSSLVTADQYVFPGHGQVSPARWQKNGRTVQGFGRMFTISEIGFQFICTADGMNDPVYSVKNAGVESGGGSAPKALSTRESGAAPTSNPGGSPATWLPPQMPPSVPPKLGFNRWYSCLLYTSRCV